jgi:ADP-ribose pyrophosphatase
MNHKTVMNLSILHFFIGVTTFVAVVLVSLYSPPEILHRSVVGDVSHGGYQGYQYINKNATLGFRTIAETPFARTQIHTVKLENGKIVNDWLWFDEGDAINCLVRIKSTLGEVERYLVFEQRKYGFDGLSLAPVGGYIENGETPLEAAKRELLEETGLQSDVWTELGGFRVAANRGAGVIFTFLAVDAEPSSIGHKLDGTDLETQRPILLTKNELLEALFSGKFKEVKWAATVALALLSTNRQPAMLKQPDEATLT